MLLFYDVGVTYLEVPNEKCLTFHISECQNNCQHCQSPWLHSSVGDNINEYFEYLIEAYSEQITCICFLGEGKNTETEHIEFYNLCNIAKKYKLKTCLYSGRDCNIEDWMKIFDYVKIGSYNKTLGAINIKTTNQRLYKKINHSFIDITKLFWS